jgi:hypothetical protein
MIATIKTKAGAVTTEATVDGLETMLTELQAWANKEGQTATVKIEIMPSGAYRASAAITKALEPFTTGRRA